MVHTTYYNNVMHHNYAPKKQFVFQIVDLESNLETPRAPVRKSVEDLLIDRLPSQPPVHDLQV